MSFVFDQAKCCLPGVAALCLLGVPPGAGAETEIPPHVRQALEKNAAALTRITAAWERKRSSTLPLPELLQRIHLPGDLAILEPYQLRYSGQDGMLHVFATYRYRAPERGVEEYDTEVAFDRKCFYSGNGIGRRKRHFPAGILRVTPLEESIKRKPDGRLWEPEYFHAAGFDLPAAPATLLQPPRSRLLALLEQGARVARVWEERRNPEAPCAVIELATPDRSYRFDLDPTHGYAVSREEERSASGALAVVTTNSDFVRLGDPEVWLPQHCRAQWHTWYSIPDQFSSSVLLVVDITVNELRQAAIPPEKFSLSDYYKSPNVLIADARLPGPSKRLMA